MADMDKPKGYQYLFGPVPSRRLGMSLGVDLVFPKTCSLDCVYCESGRTTTLTLKRSEAVPASRVIEELSLYLASSPMLDHITFSGSGEPTLNTGIRAVVDFLKTDYPDYPIALLTNSTLFSRREVRRDVRDIDLIVASLDAVSESVFQRVNRPAPGLDARMIIEGLTALRRDYAHQLWLEIFIVPGVNDSPDELNRLAMAARTMGADRIQLNSLDRPGTESWVRALAPDERQRIADCFKGIEVIGMPPHGVDRQGEDPSADVRQRILTMIRRRPCTVDDLRLSLNVGDAALTVCLGDLVREGCVKTDTLDRGVFYRIV